MLHAFNQGTIFMKACRIFNSNNLISQSSAFDNIFIQKGVNE